MEIHRLVLPVPFSIKEVNCHILDHNGVRLVVDCGTNQANSVAMLREYGVPGAPIILSHGHVDHAGAAEICRKEGSIIFASPAEGPHISTYRKNLDLRNDEYAEALLAEGVPMAAVGEMRKNVGVDLLLDDVAKVSPPDSKRDLFEHFGLKVLPAPGHTPGSLILEGENIIFTGDTLLETITSNAIEIRACERGSHQAYLETLQHLRKYADCMAHPGHFEPFKITDAIIDNHLNRQEKRQQKLLAEVATPKTAHQLRKVLWPFIPDTQSFLAMSEVIGHMNTLCNRNLAKRDLIDGVSYYRAVS